MLEYGSEATGLISLEAAAGTATATLVGQLAAPLPAVAVLTAADPTPVSLVFRAVVTVAGTIVISGDNADAAVAGTALKEDPTTSKLATGYVALRID